MSAPRRPPGRPVDGLLLLDKPKGLSSNAALQSARRLYNAIKAGHTGTLDPMATGLLPLCFGEATKFAGEMLAADKSYDATVQLGVSTDTADAEGNVLETRPVAVSRQEVDEVLARFRGDILQLPPMHSALKRAGKPLYAYARLGLEVEREERRVRIEALELLRFDADRIDLRVDCSKGTYIRTLAADIGAALGCGAHLAALRRTRIGTLSLAAAIDLEALAALSSDQRDRRLAPVDALLQALPIAELSAEQGNCLCLGQAIRWTDGTRAAGAQLPPAGRLRAYAQGRFLGLCSLSAEGWLQPQRLVATQAPVPDTLESGAQ